MTKCLRCPLFVPALALLSVAMVSAQTPVTRFDATAASVTWTTSNDHGGAVLRISGPGGTLERRIEPADTVTFGVEDFMELSPGHEDEIDGAYNWELWFEKGTFDQGGLIERTRHADGADRPSRDRNDSEDAVARGVFSLRGGAFLAPTDEPESTPSRALITKAGASDADVPTRDQVIADDLIVEASACIGTDCNNGESFGFDTVRLKENNLRLKFDDTSSSASFPSNDWQLTANDSANGGANRFSIDDISGGRTPFTIEASAPSHSLYVDDGGRVGFGTSTPVVEAHIVDGDTPTLRLEQNGSSGFNPQTWDVAGNETNFFVRDVSNGSRLPFRIFPSAPTNSLTLGTAGIGMGVTTPAASLHVQRSDGTASMLVKETSASSEKRTLLKLENSAGGVQFSFVDTANARQWNFELLNSGSFSVSRDQTGGPEMEILENGRVRMGPGSAVNFDLATNGDLTLAGTLTQGSSRTIKDVVASVSAQQVLDQVAELPLARWTYKQDEDRSVHMGPMAEDFYETFGLGSDAQHIAPADLAAVALAAVKGLQAEVEQRDARIEQLEQRLLQIEARLEKP